MTTEIEKKFKLAALPPATILGEGVAIKQGYLFTTEGEGRVRQKGNAYFLTVKGEGDLARSEWETSIPEWVFETLWRRTEGARVEKTRCSIDYEGLILEVDEYFGHLAGLVTLECEFESEEAANGFILPEWATSAEDVTSDKRYKNKALAVKGLPSN